MQHSFETKDAFTPDPVPHGHMLYFFAAICRICRKTGSQWNIGRCACSQICIWCWEV